MMPVRWLTSRSLTRCNPCRSSWSAVLVATNFIVGVAPPSAMASASRKSFSVLRIGPNVPRRHQPGHRGRPLEPAAKMMRPPRSLHSRSDKAVYSRTEFYLARDHSAAARWRRVHQATTWNEFLPMSMPTRRSESFCHGMLLVFGARISITCCWGGARPDHPISEVTTNIV